MFILLNAVKHIKFVS